MKSIHLYRAVYIAAKFNGLASFHLSSEQTGLIATLSIISTTLATFQAIGLNCLVNWSIASFLIDAPEEELEETLVFVLKLDSTACLLRNFIISIFAIVQRKAIIRLINDVHLIADRIQRLCHIDHFLEEKCLKMVRMQLQVMIFQLGISGLSIFLLIDGQHNLSIYEFFRVVFMDLLNNFFQLTVSAIHFAALLTVMQLFRHLNHRLEHCAHSIRAIMQMEENRSKRMEMYFKIINNMEEISVLYKYVTICNGRICKLFSLTMLSVLIISFVMMLSGVNCISIILFIFNNNHCSFQSYSTYTGP